MKPSIISRNIPKKILLFVSVAAFWLLLWQLVSLAVGQELLIASPLSVLRTLCSLAVTAAFWKSVLSSCFKILLGFLLGAATGTLLAVLTGFSRFFYTLTSPLLKIIRATPVASFIILALVWFKTSTLPVFISFLMVLPLIWSNVSEGIRSTDLKLLEMAKVFELSFFKRFRYLYFPSVLPYFTAACTTGIGFAWKSGIAAEVLGSPKNSIGEQLYNAKIYLETPQLFSWTIVVILLSVLIEKGFLFLLRKIKIGKEAEKHGDLS